MLRAHMVVSGFVQGVGYRYFIYHEAVAVGVTGFVKNLWSGEVEIIAEGEEWQIETLYEKAKIGPSVQGLHR
ncbi:MAG: acylphosphatase [Ignavibacteriales bacterium]|nr:acylphosphatase [Ignavibacteriales bacterium]